ncbi:MAG: prepilin-type N-terminal cleavage/methylation domain-containing protein [bacterium]
MMSKVKAFTLIELLIVVAIIAILAAIAVPNFIEAQVRSKVSRAYADIRSGATALEAYGVDWNMYPYDGYTYTAVSPPARTAAGFIYYWYLQNNLTTPQSYISSAMLIDPFRVTANPDPNYNRYRYINPDSTWGMIYAIYTGRPTPAPVTLGNIKGYWGAWRIGSAGPDRTYGPVGYKAVETGYSQFPIPYDATNGTVSQGDIQRTQRESKVQ